MLKQAFEGMKAKGIIPEKMEWNKRNFNEGFKALDKDGSGFIEIPEIEDFVKDLFSRLKSNIWGIQALGAESREQSPSPERSMKKYFSGELPTHPVLVAKRNKML